MRYFVVSSLLLSAHALAGAECLYSFQSDFDGDGLPDTVSVSPAVHDEAGSIRQTLVVRFSRNDATRVGELFSDTGPISVYPGREWELIVDYSNRNSRDSADLSYYVYRWREDDRELCLHSHIYGAPVNQLDGELVSQDISLQLFSGCSVPGGASIATEAPLVPLVSGDLRLEGLLGDEVPEWVAVELGKQATSSAADELLLLAADQKKEGNYRSSAMILHGMVENHVRMGDACAALAEVYSHAGYPFPQTECVSSSSTHSPQD